MRIYLIAILLAFVSTPAAAEAVAENLAICARMPATDATIDACTALIQSNQEDPGNRSDAYMLRAFAYQRKGQMKPAIADLTESLSLSNALHDNLRSSINYVNRGNMYARIGLDEQAISDFNSAMLLNPTEFAPYEGRAAVYDHMGRHDLAVADLTHAISLQPRFARLYLDRAYSYGAERLNDLALADYNQSIVLSPNSALAYSNRGATYENIGRKDRAVADYRAALKINPNMQAAKDGLRRLGAPF